MRSSSKFLLVLLAMASLMTACQKDISITPNQEEPKPNPNPDQEDEEIYKGLIPKQTDEIPRLYINTPNAVGVDKYDKTRWTELCSIQIKVLVNGEDRLVYEDDSLRIRGRGNSTWGHYPKKPYRFNLDHKANFIGSGQTKKWVLLANWMDRTLLRNDVALEAARHTSIEWTPAGKFVDFYLDGVHLGNYWMGEKINVEKGNILADYLFQFDSTDETWDFSSSRGVWKKGKNGGIPVHVKYPDLDDVEDPSTVIQAAQQALKTAEDGIWSDDWSDYINVDSFVDWLLVCELCMNGEARHPKSCYFYIRDGILYAGPVWDFDWGTFSANPYYNKNMTGFINFNYLYYGQLTTRKEFRQRIKERWAVLKPQFQTLDTYIDARADEIRVSEAINSTLWPFFGKDMNGKVWKGNPLAGSEGITTGEINFDETMTFREAVNAMKEALSARIGYLDKLINEL